MKVLKTTTFQDRPWICLQDINKDTFGETDPFLVAFDCFSVFSETKGILIVMSHEETISVKMTITGNSRIPLKCEDIARIKGVEGNLANQETKHSNKISKKSFFRLVGGS